MSFPESLANWAGKAGQFAARHADVVGAAVPGLLIVAVPVLVAGPLLGLAGFGAAGVSAGSAAAAAQSAVGNVVARGVFATLQSAAMGGYGVAAVHGFIQGVGALGAAVGGGYVASRKGKAGKGGEGGEGGEGGKGGKGGKGAEGAEGGEGAEGEKDDEDDEAEKDDGGEGEKETV